ncbi:MAG: hypothetical protein ACLQHF_07585 [Terracidiphilus sp.]
MRCRDWIVAFAVCAVGFAGAPLRAQWQILNSGTTADLRGIDNVGGGVAWASGTNGTVLRTEDGGYQWQPCAIPPGAEKLDFRGVQAFDANTAIVMSSGTGDLSRLYKTTDGCQTWKLVAKNPDPTGFWDAVQAEDSKSALILGDSVRSKCRMWRWDADGLNPNNRGKCDRGEGSFAASNSVLQIVKTPQVDPVWKYTLRFASGTAKRSYFTVFREERTSTCEPCRGDISRTGFFFGSSKSSGIFSFAFRDDLIGVIVGGDFKRPDESNKLVGYTEDGGISWHPSVTPLHGYRSAVAYDEASKTWITVGPNGTDVSTDDGRNWRAVHPDVAPHKAADADRNWNALSLPYVVGPHGRIGKLDRSSF